MIRHSHVQVNGKKVSIPSLQVRAGDKLEIRETSKKKKATGKVKSAKKTGKKTVKTSKKASMR